MVVYIYFSPAAWHHLVTLSLSRALARMRFAADRWLVAAGRGEVGPDSRPHCLVHVGLVCYFGLGWLVGFTLSWFWLLNNTRPIEDQTCIWCCLATSGNFSILAIFGRSYKYSCGQSI